MIARQPGASDEIMGRMAQLAETNPQVYGPMLDDDRQILTLYEIAKVQEENASLKASASAQDKTKANKAAEEAKRKATAAQRAVSPPGGVSPPAPSDQVRQKRYANMDEKMNDIAAAVRKELAG